jgi:hypothetical protein
MKGDDERRGQSEVIRYRWEESQVNQGGTGGEIIRDWVRWYIPKAIEANEANDGNL